MTGHPARRCVPDYPRAACGSRTVKPYHRFYSVTRGLQPELVHSFGLVLACNLSVKKKLSLTISNEQGSEL
ncbi:MAG: hypothetical protein JWL65_4411 [Gammaproteobacteria bacterium]|nr:hypothetical protein [Gammaproteobacteria bacterium]